MSTADAYATPASGMDYQGEEFYEPKFLSFSGRIGRIRYLAYITFLSLLMYAALFIGGMGAVIVGAEGGGISTLGLLVMGVAWIAAIIGSIVFVVRRLNDLDTSGWLSLLMLVPLVNAIFGLVLVFAPGSKGPNRYGPEPVKNSVGIMVAGLVLPVVMTIGILAAVAIPAYQGYVERADAAAVIQN